VTRRHSGNAGTGAVEAGAERVALGTRGAGIGGIFFKRPTRLLNAATYAALAAVLVGVGLWWPEQHESISWHYFNSAARSLFSVDGFHTFARHPDLQFGPVATVAAEVSRTFGGNHTADLVSWLIAAEMVPLLMIVAHIAIGYGAPRRQVRTTVFVGGLLLIVPWGELAFGTTHLDDAIALGATVVAMWAVMRQRPIAAAILLATAVDAKPWALAFAPLLLVFARRERRCALGAYLGLVSAVWLPFLVVDAKTFDAAKFTISNAAGSSLRWLGVRAATTPRWDRAAQIGIGGGIACVAALRRQWPSVMLAGMSVRILLDPGTHLYYSAGLVLGAVIFDAAVARWRLPWTAVIVLTLTVIPGRYISRVPPSIQGGARFVGTAVPLFFVLWFAGKRTIYREPDALSDSRRSALLS
jgi:hypothetical protein